MHRPAFTLLALPVCMVKSLAVALRSFNLSAPVFFGFSDIVVTSFRVLAWCRNYDFVITEFAPQERRG